MKGLRTVGSTYARTHWYALMDEVAKGATVLITRYGKPVAQMVPDHSVPQTSAKKDFSLLLALEGSGKKIWADEHADEYVRRMRR